MRWDDVDQGGMKHRLAWWKVELAAGEVVCARPVGIRGPAEHDCEGARGCQSVFREEQPSRKRRSPLTEARDAPSTITEPARMARMETPMRWSSMMSATAPQNRRWNAARAAGVLVTATKSADSICGRAARGVSSPTLTE